jgi:hypothetical protein
MLGKEFHKQPPVNYAHEVLGYFDAHGRYIQTETRKAWEHGGLLGLDEFDASSADAGLAFNPVTDGSESMAYPDGMIARHPGLQIVAMVNTDGTGATMDYPGRVRLDGATINRFRRIQWGYDPALEDRLGADYPHWVDAVRAVRTFVLKRGILDVVATMRDIVEGCKMLRAGIAPVDVLEASLQLGATKEAWPEVLRLEPVAKFLRG